MPFLTLRLCVKPNKPLTTSPISNNKFKLVFAAGWVAWAMVHYSVLLNFGITHAEAICDSLISNLTLATCCIIVSNNMRYYLPKQEKYWYVLVISFGMGCVWMIAYRSLLWLFFHKHTTYMQVLDQSSTIRFGIAFLVIGFMATINLLWYTQKEQQEADERKTEAEKIARESELFKLRQQLQPHFLFNSLNSISALTGSQPEKARHMIEQLSDFLRGTLKKDEQQWSSFEEELQYLQLYLDIEKVRFGYRLQTEITHDEGTLQMKLPSMLLQPVVENAIKFGLYDTIGEVCIAITTKNVNGTLEVTVQNPFDKETSQPLQGTGFGLASIQRRLFLLFARHDLLQTKTINDHFITTITIPQII